MSRARSPLPSSVKLGFLFFNFMKTFRLYYLLLTFLVIGCKRDVQGIIDTTGLPPFISQATLSTTLINTDTIFVSSQRLPTDTLTINISAFVKASDPDGDIDQVIYQVFKPNSQTVVASGQLHDDGRDPDLIAGDGIYSGNISFKIQRTDVGQFMIGFLANDKRQLSSNLVLTGISVVRGNRPPTLSNLQAPDTVAVSNSTVLIKLSVQADDPDGLNDIQKVWFNSFKPDGTPSSGNPFQMYDDGNAGGISGDSVAGDGIYSLIIQLPPTSIKGTYRFEFQASDRSQALSNILVHKLTVK